MGRVADVLKTMEYGKAPESASLANQWLERHGRRFGLFVDGDFMRMSQNLYPGSSRVYAKVLTGGTICPGDSIEAI